MASVPTAPPGTIITGSRRYVAALALAASNFMVVLDTSIANVSLPHIAGNLGVTPDQGTWVITTYAVAEAVCVPLTGWIAMRFGPVKAFTICLFAFGLASMMCGMSVTLPMLVFFRLVQGLVGGPLMPLSQTLLMSLFPPDKRGTAMGIWAMTTLLGPAFGPNVGGYISDNYSWHWIFLINIPISVICGFAALLMLRPLETPKVRQPIDRIGLALLVTFVFSLQLMLDFGRDRDWFSSNLIVTLAIVAVIGFIAFVIWELTEEHPIVDLRIFRHRGFSAAVVAFSVVFGTYFSSVVVIPQWLQTSMGYTATTAGLVTGFSAMTSLSTSPVAAKLVGKVDSRILISGAVLWLAFISILRTRWTTSSGFWDIAMVQVIQGFGIPFMMVPLTTLTLSTVEPREIAGAAGIQNFMRTTSMAVTTSLILTLWSNAQRSLRTDLVAGLHPGDLPTQLGNAGFSVDQTREVISNLVEQQSTMLAINYVSLISAVLMVIAAGMIWLSPKPTGPAPADTGGH